MTTPLGTARNPREVELKFHLPKGSRALLESYPALAAAAGIADTASIGFSVTSLQEHHQAIPR